MKLTTSAAIEIARPREEVFDVALDATRLPRIMKPVRPIPGVVAVEMDGGAAPAAGARRRVTMSDGSVMGEEITALERPRAYAYRWLNRPAAPFDLLVRTAAADWTFREADRGARVEWIYTFELTSPLAWPAAWAATRLFARWMRAALAELQTLAEGAPR
jgi:hypothetical protein